MLFPSIEISGYMPHKHNVSFEYRNLTASCKLSKLLAAVRARIGVIFPKGYFIQISGSPSSKPIHLVRLFILDYFPVKSWRTSTRGYSHFGLTLASSNLGIKSTYN